MATPKSVVETPPPVIARIRQRRRLEIYPDEDAPVPEPTAHEIAAFAVTTRVRPRSSLVQRAQEA